MSKAIKKFAKDAVNTKITGIEDVDGDNAIVSVETYDGDTKVGEGKLVCFQGNYIEIYENDFISNGFVISKSKEYLVLPTARTVPSGIGMK